MAKERHGSLGEAGVAESESLGVREMGERNMVQGNMDYYYCKGIVPSTYHSNVRRGNGVDRRSWRDFWSLVRQNLWKSGPFPLWANGIGKA